MTKNKILYLLIFILIIWCVILTSILSSKNNNPNVQPIGEYYVSGISTDLTKIVNDKKSSIVTINANNNLSTGFVYRQVDNDVYILTSYHGIGDNPISVVFASGYTSEATLIGYDLYCDLAVIKIDSPYNIDCLKLANTNECKAGEFVISIGTPISLEYDHSIELGIISNPLRSIENSITIEKDKYIYYQDVIQLSSNLKPGYSGSPLINNAGYVIGMTTMSLNNQINFAITSNEIERVANSIIDNTYKPKVLLGFTGMYIENMESYEKNNLNIYVDIINGVYIKKVLDNSISFNAGLRNGDVLISINEHTINNFNEYLDIIYSDATSFEFQIIRDSQTITLKASLDD